MGVGRVVGPGCGCCEQAGRGPWSVPAQVQTPSGQPGLVRAGQGRSGLSAWPRCGPGGQIPLKMWLSEAPWTRSAVRRPREETGLHRNHSPCVSSLSHRTRLASDTRWVSCGLIGF